MASRSIGSGLALAFALALGPVLSASAQDAAGIELELESLDGERTRYALTDGPLTDPRELGGWLVRPIGAPRFEPPLGAQPAGEVAIIELVGGDVLHGRIESGEGDKLVVQLIGGVRVTLDILTIRRVDLPGRRPAGLLVRLEAPSEGDRLYRVTGRDLDPTTGMVDSFTAQGVRFESPAVGLKTYPWREIAALFIEAIDEVRQEESTHLVPVVLDLSDRSRIGGWLIRMDLEGCSVLAAATELVFPWSVVEELSIADGSLTYLSTQLALSEEGRGSPFGDDLGRQWRHRVDRAVDGSELVTAGRHFRRGIGTHAPTRVTWSLDGEADALRGYVGIDDSVLVNPPDARGAVIFRVLLDGEIAWQSSTVRGGDAPVRIPSIELGAARELTLEADMLDDFRGDRANWIRMLLIDRPN